MSDAVAFGSSAAKAQSNNPIEQGWNTTGASLCHARYALSLDERESLGSRLTRYAVVAALHAGALALVLSIQPRLVQDVLPAVLTVRTIVEAPLLALKPELIPPKPVPQAKAVKQTTVAPSPVMTAASTEPSATSFAVAPQPAPAPPLAPPAPSAPVATAPAIASVTAARFDADYLKNPPPAYPALSRRMREEGTVLVLVQVSAQGTAAQVRVRQSSGHPRLDEAALEAVRQWRFVPAKRGDEAIAASVIVPVVFRIE